MKYKKSMEKKITNQKPAWFVALFFVISNATTAQTYFAGTNAGNGNTAASAVGIGPNALAVSNSGPLNLGVGIGALNVNSTGNANVAIGNFSMNLNKTGKANTATGTYALNRNVSGDSNTVNGYMAMYLNTTGKKNTATGVYSLYRNVSGHSNIANGYLALRNNTTGSSNVAVGVAALYDNSTGFNNTAIGDSALMNNTSGKENVAVGNLSLLSNVLGRSNTSIGYAAMQNLQVGNMNTAVGSNAMFFSDSTENSIAIGVLALGGGVSNSVAIGNNALGLAQHPGNSVAIGNMAGYESGYSNVLIGNGAASSLECVIDNVAIGNKAGVGNQSRFYNKCVFVGNNTAFTNSNVVRADSNSIAIGYNAKVDASNKVVIGNTDITSIGGQVGWTTYSDQRLKTNISKNKLGLDFIMQLNPVNYNYKAEGQKNIIYTGLIAQEVDEAAKKSGVVFSGVDKRGEYWGIRYGELTVPLIQAMQEMEKKYKAELETLNSRLEKLELALQQKEQSGLAISEKSFLFQNQPNPFNAATTIRYQLRANQKNGTLIIRDINGRLVKQLNVTAEKESITIGAGELPAGTYTYSLLVNGVDVSTKKMILVK